MTIASKTVQDLLFVVVQAGTLDTRLYSEAAKIIGPFMDPVVC